MILFQILLTFFLLLVVIYGAAPTSASRGVRLVVALVGLAAVVTVWHPDLASRAASLLGIGRGSDLILYCWMVISFGLFIRISVQLRRQQVLITQLARRIAVDGAVAESPPVELGSAFARKA